MSASTHGGTGERLDWADIAKGMSIILVVMMHSTLGVQHAAGATGWLGPVVAFAQPFRMPAFFLLAGFFFASMLGRSWRDVIDRRVLGYVWVLLLWSFILALLRGDVLQAVLAGEAVRSALLHLVEPNGALWFLHALALFALAAKLTARIPALPLLGAAALLHCANVQTGWTLPDEFASRFVFFLAGCRLAPRIVEFASWARRAPALATCIVLAAALGTAFAVFPHLAGFDAAQLGPEAPLSLLLGAFGALGVVAFATLLERSPVAGLLSGLGRRTLAIYVAFTVPMAAARIALLRFDAPLDIGTMSLVVTLVALAAPLVLLRLAGPLRLGFVFRRPGWFALPPVRPEPAQPTPPQRNEAISPSGFLSIAGTRQPSAG